MRHVKYLSVFFVLSSLCATSLFADEADSKVKLGGELRLRNENYLNQQKIVGGTVDDDAAVLLRARINVDATPFEQLHIFLQPQFSRSFAQEGSTVANGTNIDDLDLHQAFMEFSKINDSRFSVKVGRQELTYGDQRLVGNFSWSNVGRNFDALKVRYAAEKFWVDAFGSWVVKSGPNQYFSGLYGSYTGWAKHSIDPYLFYLHSNAGSSAADKLKLATPGIRFVGSHNAWDYGAEAAVQIGKSEPNNALAYAGHARAGYTFAPSWKPRAGLEYNFASGENSGSKDTRFNNLFPTNHDKYGLMDLVGWRNIHDFDVNIGAQPSEQWKLRADYHLFMLPEASDALYRASGAVLRAGAAGASRLAGHEVDLTAQFIWNKYADFLLGYSFFKTGKFFSDTGSSGLMHFAYLQATAKF